MRILREFTETVQWFRDLARYGLTALQYPATNEWEFCTGEPKMYTRKAGSGTVIKRDMTDKEFNDWRSKEAL